jgi:hypothetical protein
LVTQPDRKQSEIKPSNPGNTSPSIYEISPVKIEMKIEQIQMEVSASIPLEEVQLQICNGVISSDLFINSISKTMFQNNMPEIA